MIRAISASITTRRMPEKPRLRLLTLSTMTRRTSSSLIGWPTPAAWDSTSERCRFSRSSLAMRVEASRPKPVLMP
ncbi:hypothetical protein D3C86_1792340 [compost metagenome]